LLHLQVRDLAPLKLRYDTADNLRLRKILDPSKPQHAAVLASMGSMTASSSAAGELTPLLVQLSCGTDMVLVSSLGSTAGSSSAAGELTLLLARANWTCAVALLACC
jgi:hypothetical protein